MFKGTGLRKELQRKILVLLFVMTFAASAIPSAISAYNGIDPTIPLSNKGFSWCASAIELDCVESFSVRHPDGKVETPKDYPNFTFHKGSMSGPLMNLQFWIEISTPALWDIKKTMGVDFPVLGIYAGAGIESVDPDDIFTVALRTSWLNPLDVSGFARNSQVSETRIPGGRKWVLTGQQAITYVFNESHQSWYSDLWIPTAPLRAADEDRAVMYWRIDHINPVPNGSPFDTTCSETGYTVTSSNASSAGMPTMIGPDTLSYNVSAPHFKQDGKTITEGFFQATLPLAWLDCKWPGNTLSKAAYVSISVTDDTGERQVVSSTAVIKDGKLDIKVSGFHYSAPKIQVRPATSAELDPTVKPTPTPTAIGDPVGAIGGNPTPTPTASPTKKPSVAKSTITCVKGKLSKKVTAVKPICPKGYKKK
jgi:hypothetical protein